MLKMGYPHATTVMLNSALWELIGSFLRKGKRFDPFKALQSLMPLMQNKKKNNG